MLAVRHNGGSKNMLEEFTLTTTDLRSVRTLTFAFGSITGVVKWHGLLWLLASDHLKCIEPETGNLISDVALTSWGTSLFGLAISRGLFETSIYVNPYSHYFFDASGKLYDEIIPDLNFGGNDIDRHGNQVVVTRQSGRTMLVGNDTNRHTVISTITQAGGFTHWNGLSYFFDVDGYQLNAMHYPPVDMTTLQYYAPSDVYNQLAA